MKICIIDVLGLPFDGTTLEKQGLGGSESAVISISRELVKIGFEVTVFNDCESNNCKEGMYDGVYYFPLSNIENNDENYDLLIASRSVAPICGKDHSYLNNLGNPIDFDKIFNRSSKRVLWMHDTFCDGDDLIEDLIQMGRLDEIFTLSDFHTNYVANCEHGRKRNFEVLKDHIFQTRNGINKHIDWVDISKKDPNHFVYNASVSKGMEPLVKYIWPKVLEQIPNAKLTIIGGYYNFKDSSNPDEQEQKWRVLQSYNEESIKFTGVIAQQEIATILANASYMIYPAAFPETFGISSLESLYYNTPIITCDFGALEETAINSACYKIPYAIEPNSLFPDINSERQIDNFVNMVIQAHNDTYLHQQKMYACNQVDDICGWDSVAIQWKQHIFNMMGDYLPVDDYREVSHINNEVRRIFGRRFTNKEENSVVKKREKMILVVSPTYNSGDAVQKCVDSVAAQDYDNYLHVVISDGCTDNSIKKLNKPNGIIIDKVKHSGSAVKNQIETIEKYKDFTDAIVVLLDGDDRLVNDPNIFHKINNLYHDGYEFTYGSCWSDADNIPLIAQEYPPEVKETKSYRDHKFNWNIPYTHLRTFDIKLIHNVNQNELRDEAGNWLKAGADVALFYNLIELVDPDKIKAVPDILCHYNDLNPMNDYKINSEEQTRNAKNAMNNKKKKILIAVPTDKNIEAETYRSIYNMKVPEGYETNFQYFYGYRVDQVRNLIADWSVNNKFDYVLCIDHDIVLPEDALENLLSHDKKIVSGVYRQRLEPPVLELYDMNYRNIESIDYSKNLIEIGACGFGCVLVKTSLFAQIDYPQFFYRHAIDHNDTISEDVYFCEKASAFTKIYADTRVKCGHIGQKSFNVD